MTHARLRIEACGPLTSLQDSGRPGWLRYGVPGSGPVDRLVFAAARRALDAPPDWTAIELSQGGITLMCEAGALSFVLTGTGFKARVDGAHVGDWTMGRLRAGQRLAIRAAHANWGYLGFAGRVEASRWLGSTATHAPSGLGGGSLAAGGALSVSDLWHTDARPLARPADEPTPFTARALPGPQSHAFAPASLHTLIEGVLRTTARFDRMGMVLDTSPLLPLNIDLVSAPVTRGALQIDGTGRATLLLADHQTTGGYPRLATLIAQDADRIARVPPGTPFHIALVTPTEAIAIARAEAARDEVWLAGLANAEPLHARLASANLISGVVASGPASRDALR